MRHLFLFLLLLPLTGCISQLRDTGRTPMDQDWNVINRRSLKIELDRSAFAEPAPGWEPERLKDKDLPIPKLADEATTRSVAFIIEEPEWVAPEAFPDHSEKQDAILFCVRERLYRYLLRKYPAPVRVRYAYLKSDPALQGVRIVTVTSAVTDFKKGNGIIRYLLGHGAGKVYIQIEGEIFEGPEKERLIGRFMIRRGHGAYGQSGYNPNVIKDDYVMKYAVEQAIDHLSQRFPLFIPGEEVVPEEEGPATASPGETDPHLMVQAGHPAN